MEISVKTILKVLGILLILWVLYVSRDIVALFFLSVIFTATLDPAIDRMQHKKIPRPVSVFIIYIAVIGIVGGAISLLIPPIVSQTKDFATNFPAYSDKLSTTFSGIELYAKSYGIDLNIQNMVKDSLGGAVQTSGQIFSTTVGVFTVFISLIVVLSLTFYMSVKEDGMKGFIVSLTPKDHREHMVSLVERIQKKVGRWMFGQIILMVVIFILDFSALSLLGIPYALILALVAGILEIVPYLGPIISATLATLVGLMISPLTGVEILITLTIIQQLESHVIVPQIMKKAVGLNPVVVILALLIGAKLGGTIGAILSVPIATALGVFVQDLAEGRK
jgi:predicted PurR-regulated permease PerM